MILQNKILDAIRELRAMGVKPDSIRLTDDVFKALKVEVELTVCGVTGPEREDIAWFMGLPIFVADGGISAVLGWRGTAPVAALILTP